MPTIRVAIAGATGYAGQELIRLLLQHPAVRLTYLAASAKWERPTPASVVFPRFANRLSLPIEALDPARLSAESDVVFLALPHGTSMGIVPTLLQAGKRVVDLSGDFRLKEASDYPSWYQFSHAHPELLDGAGVVYGLTEFHRDELPKARLVANPGCYATSILLGCLPLFQAGVVEEASMIVDAKSGLSGAGRKADESLLFTEMTENLRAYKVNRHQHMPEVLQEITRLTGHTVRMVFVPQVIPVTRGLMSTIYLRTATPFDRICEIYRQAYPGNRAPFVRLRPGELPQLKDVVDTNYCDVGVMDAGDLRCLIVASALDNLTKGAAGQAIQNFNLMCGLPETMGLL